MLYDLKNNICGVGREVDCVGLENQKSGKPAPGFESLTPRLS